MEFHTVVIGTGFSGLGMAIQLKRDGRDDFVVPPASTATPP
jgi:cation diffusion facilitator CzcD-associated flavoprotein CzcO